MFEVDKSSKEYISTQIYENIKAKILDSSYKHKDKLPSIREGAEKLCVSKTVISSAYFQLCTEGYTENIAYKGYYICKIRGIKTNNSSLDLYYRDQNIVYINDGIDEEAFPKDVWRKTYNKMILGNDVDFTCQGDEQGEYELRKAIADFVRAHRDCKVLPEQIVVASGIQSLISLLIKITKKNCSSVYLEMPSYKKVEYVFRDYDYEIKKVPVLEGGINIESLANCENSFIYVSPSYQYPLGNLMPIDKRLELINYAKEKNCLIIEDDYASTIRYDSKPISSLQGLDSFDNTIYLGSFSKTFLPSLRISFMILPKKILGDYYKIKSKYTHTCSKLEQLTLAKLISSGQMEKNLRKINNIYKQKNQLITKYIKENFADRLIVHNNQSGFHIILSCKTKRDIDFLEELKNEFLLIEIIEFKEENLLFLFSFSGLKLEEIPKTINVLAKILKI